MNEVYDAETAALLKELEAEGNVSAEEPTEAPTEEPAPETVVEPKEEAPSKEEPEVTEEPVIDRAPKEPALMPAWQHKVAQKEWEKEREQLARELETLRANPTQANREAAEETAQNLRDLAREHGLELDENQERFFNSLLKRAVPQDLTKKLQALEADRQIAFLETQYEQEFSKDVEPLIKERYGEVSASKLAELKKSLHDLAFTETYAKVPLKKVFYAEQDTFKIEPVMHKKTMDTTKPGKSRSVEIDYSRVTEEDVANMSPEDFDKYSDNLAGKSSWRR